MRTRKIVKLDIEIHYASKRGLANIVKELVETREDLIEYMLETTSISA